MFNTHRMVQEYWDRFYMPAAERGFQLMENGWENLKKSGPVAGEIMYNWSEVTIKDIRMQVLMRSKPVPLTTWKAISPWVNCSPRTCWLGLLRPVDLPTNQDRFTYAIDPRGGSGGFHISIPMRYPV